MLDPKMQSALNEQIKEELSSAYLYLAMAAYLAAEGWDGMAKWMRVQAREEVEHAMRLFDHVLERGGEVELLALPQPQKTWDSPLAVFQAAYKHECYISDRINKLLDLARELNDYATQTMLHWFVTEQVEEEDQTRKIVELMERVGDSGRGLALVDQRLGAREG